MMKIEIDTRDAITVAGAAILAYWLLLPGRDQRSDGAFEVSRPAAVVPWTQAPFAADGAPSADPPSSARLDAPAFNPTDPWLP